MFNFKEKVVLISGASRGIGAAAAVRFAEAGAKGVVIQYHTNREAAEVVASRVAALGSDPLIVRADIGHQDEVSSLFQACRGHFGRLDIVVGNAGIWPPDERLIGDISRSQWSQTLRVNLDGMFYLCREAAHTFIGQKDGVIVTVSSTAGQRGEAGHSDYAASKGAVISLTKSLATELGPSGIRVNCVAPGWVDTEMSQPALHSTPDALEKITASIPLRRVATADDIAGPIVFLASDLARHITGEILNINGGAVLCG